MGLMVSILFSYVGAVEFVFIVRDIVHQVDLHQRRLQQSNEDLDDDLHRMQDTLKQQLCIARQCESENVQCMQDGILYENGYRVEDVADDWIEVRRAIEKRHDVADGSDSPDQSSNSQSNGSSNTVIENKKVDANGRNDAIRSHSSSPEAPDIHFDAYSESYLRSLDGIKLRPLVRDDGGRRRRAFKQNNSGSSQSSAVSLSREEELQMFTSLEEEEFEGLRNSNFKQLQYSSEPNLKVTQHSRRHKHSPVQDLTGGGSDVIEEINDPWGDVKPEHYHDSDLWKKERNMSIAEADDDASNNAQQQAKHRLAANLKNGTTDFDRCYSPVGRKYTKKYSFEEASDADHTRALSILRAQTSQDDTTTDEKTNSQPNVSTSDELLINPAEIASINANATNENENESFACSAAVPVIVAPDIQVEEIDVDFSRTNDFGAIADDGKIEEFMNYIEKVDRERTNLENKLNFREYLDESPHRLRYPSYNFDGKDPDTEDLNINVLPDDTDDPSDDDAKEVNQKFLNGEKLCELESRRGFSSALNGSRRSSIPLPLNEASDSQSENRLLFNHSPIQRIQRVDNSPSASRRSSLITKDLTRSESQASINEIDFVFVENADQSEQLETPFKELDTNRAQIVKISNMKPPKSRSVSYAGLTVGNSSLENIRNANEPLNTGSSLAETTLKSLAREDSWVSIESNTRYERSPSRCSELEYIPGRDDWRAMKSLHSDPHIDSDDYHHHRRFSETTDTLEYIKGRDDWLRMEANQGRSSTLPWIHEGKSHFDIKDELDADEYHHYRCFGEIISHASKMSHEVFIAQGSARSGRERSPYRVLRTDINKDEFIERYYWKGEDTPELMFSRTGSGTSEAFFLDAHDSRIQSERYIWVAGSERSRSKSPLSEAQIIVPSLTADSRDSSSRDISVVTEDDYEESTMNDHDVIDNSTDDHIFTSTDESIEVVVLNLKEDISDDKLKEPIIVISGMGDVINCGNDRKGSKERIGSDEQAKYESQLNAQNEEITNEYGQQSSAESDGNAKTEQTNLEEYATNIQNNTEMVNSIEDLTGSLETIEFENNINEGNNNTTLFESASSSTNQKIDSRKTKVVIPSPAASSLRETDKPVDNEIRETQQNITNIRRKTRKSLQFDNLEDLIKEGSLGPWFHK